MHMAYTKTSDFMNASISLAYNPHVIPTSSHTYTSSLRVVLRWGTEQRNERPTLMMMIYLFVKTQQWTQGSMKLSVQR